MSQANVWQPTTKISGNTKSISQSFIATVSQVVFNIGLFTYAPATGALDVHKNGLLLDKDVDWVETSSSSFSLLVPANVNDKVIATGKVGIEGIINLTDKLTAVTLIASKTPVGVSLVTTVGFTVPGDGGGAQWKLNGTVGQPVSQSPADLGDALLNDASGNQWAMILSNDFEFETLTELQASNIGNVFQTIICRELSSSKYIIQPTSYTPIFGDLTLGSGLTCKFLAKQLTTHINIAGYGTAADFLADTQPIMQQIINEHGSNTIIEFDPKHIYNFATKQNFKPPQLVAATYCVSIDGLEDFELRGNGSVITFSGEAADDGHIWLGIYTTDDAVAMGMRSRRIKINGFTVIGNRPPSVVKWQTFALVASTDGILIENIHLTTGWNEGSSSIIQGDNNQRFSMRKCSGFGLSTVFDIANFEDVSIDDCYFNSLSSVNPIAGFNLFYAPLVYNNGNLSRAMRKGYGSNVVLGKSLVFVGCGNGVRIEAQVDTFVHCQMYNGTGNGILVDTDPAAVGLGFVTDGVYIDGAIMRGNEDSGVKVADSADIKNVSVTNSKIYNNLHGITGGNNIVRMFEFNNDYVTRGGGAQDRNGSKTTLNINTEDATTCVLEPESTSANAPMSLMSKGTSKCSVGDDGTLKLNVTRTPTSDAAVTGYIEVFDKANVLRKLAIID